MEKMERISWILGRVHEMVNKIEHFMAMKSDTQRMSDVSSQMLVQCETNKSNYLELQ